MQRRARGSSRVSRIIREYSTSCVPLEFELLARDAGTVSPPYRRRFPVQISLSARENRANEERRSVKAKAAPGASF